MHSLLSTALSEGGYYTIVAVMNRQRDIGELEEFAGQGNLTLVSRMWQLMREENITLDTDTPGINQRFWDLADSLGISDMEKLTYIATAGKRPLSKDAALPHAGASRFVDGMGFNWEWATPPGFERRLDQFCSYSLALFLEDPDDFRPGSSEQLHRRPPRIRSPHQPRRRHRSQSSGCLAAAPRTIPPCHYPAHRYRAALRGPPRERKFPLAVPRRRNRARPDHPAHARQLSSAGAPRLGDARRRRNERGCNGASLHELGRVGVHDQVDRGAAAPGAERAALSIIFRRAPSGDVRWGQDGWLAIPGRGPAPRRGGAPTHLRPFSEPSFPPRMPAEAGIPNEFQFVAGLGRNLTAATLAESLEGYAHAIVPVSELSETALWYLHKGLYSFTSVMSREVAALIWAVEQRPSSDPSSTLSALQAAHVYDARIETALSSPGTLVTLSTAGDPPMLLGGSFFALVAVGKLLVEMTSSVEWSTVTRPQAGNSEGAIPFGNHIHAILRDLREETLWINDPLTTHLATHHD